MASHPVREAQEFLKLSASAGLRMQAECDDRRRAQPYALNHHSLGSCKACLTREHFVRAALNLHHYAGHAAFINADVTIPWGWVQFDQEGVNIETERICRSGDGVVFGHDETFAFIDLPRLRNGNCHDEVPRRSSDGEHSLGSAAPIVSDPSNRATQRNM